MFHVKHSDALREYCRLLLAAPVSLTAVTDPAAAWELHVLDSLTAMPVIAERAPRTLIDVGSGGGSPGIPIAIETGLAVDLLESRERKSEFLRTTVEALGLPCGVITERSEDFARADGRDRYDMALARALAPPPVALELCLPLVRSGGTVILWMGMVPLEPLAQVCGELSAAIAGAEPVSDTHQLLVVDKLGDTPERYPRRAGMAAKRPLG